MPTRDLPTSLYHDKSLASMTQHQHTVTGLLPSPVQKVLHRIFPFLIILLVVLAGLPSFVRALIRDPKVLKSLRRTRETFFGAAFPVVAPLFDWSVSLSPLCCEWLDQSFRRLYRPYKIPVLSQAHGVVLDVGSGTGANLHYLPVAKISKLILVEPNRGMHPKLRENVRKAGFREGQYVMCDCGAQEEEKVFEKAGIDRGEVDTVVSVFALCSIPDPQKSASCVWTRASSDLFGVVGSLRRCTVI